MLTTGTESSRKSQHVRVTRVRLSDGQRIVGVKVPLYRLMNWKGILARAGVQIDAAAQTTIDLVEKDAQAQAKHSAADEGDTSARKSGGGMGAAADAAGGKGDDAAAA